MLSYAVVHSVDRRLAMLYEDTWFEEVEEG